MLKKMLWTEIGVTLAWRGVLEICHISIEIVDPIKKRLVEVSAFPV